MAHPMNDRATSVLNLYPKMIVKLKAKIEGYLVYRKVKTSRNGNEFISFKREI